MNKFSVEEGEIGEQSNFGMGELELLNTKLFFSIGKWNAKPKSAGAGREGISEEARAHLCYIHIHKGDCRKTYKYVR